MLGSPIWSLYNRLISGGNADDFLQTTRALLTTEVLKEIERRTREQSDSSIWREMRYGRITASIVHAVSRCQTNDGALVAQIFGARIPDTNAMKRGKVLEDKVIIFPIALSTGEGSRYLY